MRTVLMTMMLAASTIAADGPAGVLQTLPLGKALTEVRTAAKTVAGDMGSQAIDNGLKTWLGEKGFQGIDLTQSLLGYVVYDEKDVEKASFVLVAGITKEADFIDFLERAHTKPEAVKDTPGAYKLGVINVPNQPSYEVMMRIDGSKAYIGFNVPVANLAADKVWKADKLYDAKETALIAFRQYYDRMPKDAIKNAAKAYDDVMKQMKDATGGQVPEPVMEAFRKIMGHFLKMSEETSESGSRLVIDNTSGEVSISSYMIPKTGTDFAKGVTARTASVNQFGAIAGATTAADVMMQFPVGLKDMQDLMVFGLETVQNKSKENPPPAFAKDIVDESLKGLIRTVKSGTMDFGIAVNGPDKDGHFVAIAGLSFADALPIEKAIKANAKDFPPNVANVLKIDVDKIGDVNIHAIDPPEDGEPEGYSKLFGDRKIYVTFSEKSICAAVGNGAKDALKLALTSKPAPANAFDIQVNPKRFGQAVTAANPQAGAMVEKFVGTEDKLLSCYTFSISGGDALRMKFSMNLKTIPRWVFLAVGGAGG